MSIRLLEDEFVFYDGLEGPAEPEPDSSGEGATGDLPVALTADSHHRVWRPEAGGVAGVGVRRGLVLPDVPAAWSFDTFAGRLGEISARFASARLTLVFRLVHEAQVRGEPAAWIGRRESVFYPLDVAEAGVDLDAFAVVWAEDAHRAARAAEHLLRSGAFGLVVLDLDPGARLAPAAQARLAALAQAHHAAVLCLTEKDRERPSLGSLVSIRAEARRTRRHENRFRCEVRALKDKRRGPGWSHAELVHGPDGLR